MKKKRKKKKARQDYEKIGKWQNNCMGFGVPTVFHHTCICCGYGLGHMYPCHTRVPPYWHLILKCQSNTNNAVQAKVKWIAMISHENFHLSVNGDWETYHEPAWNWPFMKTKASCYLVQPFASWWAEIWQMAWHGTKQLVDTNMNFKLSNFNQLTFDNGIKICHTCFQVSPSVPDIISQCSLLP